MSIAVGAVTVEGHVGPGFERVATPLRRISSDGTSSAARAARITAA